MPFPLTILAHCFLFNTAFSREASGLETPTHHRGWTLLFEGLLKNKKKADEMKAAGTWQLAVGLKKKKKREALKSVVFSSHLGAGASTARKVLLAVLPSRNVLRL